MRFTILIIYSAIFFGLLSCVDRINDPPDSGDSPTGSALVKTVGSSNSFELMTWNIENFPLDGSTTVNRVKTIIRDLDVDLIAVQEIGSISSFGVLLDSLPGWNGALSNDSYGSWYQKTGFLYKSDLISLTNVHNIFDGEHDWYAFPRPPLTAYVKIKDGSGTKFDFNLIVLHLKASGGEENEARRRAACNALKEYMDAEISSGADPDFIVLGDWNDVLIDAQNTNVFTAFLDDPDHYRFLTKNLGSQYSYINTTFKSLIDNILISSDTENEFGTGLTKVLYLDSEFRQYPSEVSDHRPVVAVFAGFTID